jgi:DNA invertase Pin-like site-specific DNA recombinase
MGELKIVKSGPPMLRVYLRRSKADEGHQQFSLDVQREGCRRFAVEELPRRSINVSWARRVEYIDDDRAGDDVLGRTELRRMRNEVQPGDVVLCRDQSRLGRDALEVTLAIRELVRDHGARLMYYATGQDVPFANAIDAATTFIGGVGHQMELEAIRSRTREALRARVRAGRIAGGRCYGYALKREADSFGRQYTVAIVDEAEANVIRRIFAWYLEGWGLKKIAAKLNAEGIRSPVAGRRGTNSWSPTCVRELLRRERYRGVYRHGLIHRVRRGGKRVCVPGRPEEVITRDIPEWRIVDDSTWFAAQELNVGRRREIRAPGPAARYPLSGVARCGTCGELARAVATAGDDIPELVAELRVRNERIRRLEADLEASKRSPAKVAELLDRAQASARAKLADLQRGLQADMAGMREVFLALFPDGLTFTPAENASRRVWAISGKARLDSVKLTGDPSGIRTRVRGLKGHCPGPG